MTTKRSCCVKLKCACWEQIEAFKVIAELNQSVTVTILINCLESLVGQVDDDAHTSVCSQQEKAPVVELDDKFDEQPPPVINVKSNLNDMKSTKVSNKVLMASVNCRKSLRGRLQEWEEKCRDILQTLWLQPDSLPFRQFVNLNECPDYNEIIDTPMCLEKIKENLYCGQYDGPSCFHKDVMQIFHNSQIYNKGEPTSQIFLMTKKLKSFYELIVQDKGLVINGERFKKSDKPSTVVASGAVEKKSLKKVVNRPKIAQQKVELNDPAEDEVQKDLISATPTIIMNEVTKKIKRKKGPGKTKRSDRLRRKKKVNDRRLNGHQADEKAPPPRVHPVFITRNRHNNSLNMNKLREADKFIKQRKGHQAFTCLICQKSHFRLRWNARMHVRRVHFKDRYLCSTCDQQFYNTSMLKAHRLQVHKET